ncbi:hypothetical protein L6164_036871 [Bauhinia variegata]|uniref:Uncharacterized protein n=1 Tax=Bauhinia variegata TaxID=167791 RepID=A0ACB9KID7_BAUVA|nr:hypothetical protein L6164_036871 [Bauhinia variegata]
MAAQHKAGSPHLIGDGMYEEDLEFPRLFRIPVTALNIIWGKDPRFWRIIPFTDTDEDVRSTGFKQSALLVQVNWLEVTGKLPVSLFRSGSATKYEIYYAVNFRVDAFGWHSAPIRFKVRVNGEETEKSMILEPYREKYGVWQEIHGGEFSVSDVVDNGDGEVKFGMYEVDSDWWKGSMVLAGVKIMAKAGN